MEHDLMGTPSADDRDQSTAQQSLLIEQSSPVSLLPNPLCSEMSLLMLATHCLRELGKYRRGEPGTETYGVELFRRATIQGDQEARVWVQRCFDALVRNWLHCHPSYEAAYRLESEENYVAQAFERFWQATATNKRVEFSTLAAALQYLRACLNGVILDTLRSYGQPREASLPEPEEAGEPQVINSTESGEVWGLLKMVLSNAHEQRLAYLLFHCGLKPGEIVRFCPREFSDIHEIYRLRLNLMALLLSNADFLQWQLS